MIRKLIRLRRIRERFFDTKLFSDPAWDMLLDLTAAYGENRPVTVSSLCAASGLPMATALRRIDDMIAAGLIERQPDKTDRRRIFVVPTEKAAESIGNFFAEVDCPTMMV